MLYACLRRFIFCLKVERGGHKLIALWQSRWSSFESKQRRLGGHFCESVAERLDGQIWRCIRDYIVALNDCMRSLNLAVAQLAGKWKGCFCSESIMRRKDANNLKRGQIQYTQGSTWDKWTLEADEILHKLFRITERMTFDQGIDNMFADRMIYVHVP